MAPGTQSLSSAQVVRQASSPQTYGEQATGSAGAHAPSSVQMPLPIATPSRHVGAGPQATPGVTGLEQSPMCGSQIPGAWHSSTAGHSTGVWTHCPLTQASIVQGLLSSQLMPQPPQLAGSSRNEVTGRHVPSHSTVPLGQAQPQVRLSSTLPSGQTEDTQAAPQNVVPAGHGAQTRRTPSRHWPVQQSACSRQIRPGARLGRRGGQAGQEAAKRNGHARRDAAQQTAARGRAGETSCQLVKTLSVHRSTSSLLMGIAGQPQERENVWLV